MYKKMTKEMFDKLQAEEHYNPTIIFSLRDKELTKEDKRYKFIIFNHVQLHFPFNATIVEAFGTFDAIKYESADCYMDFNGTKIVLPLFVREAHQNYRYDKDMPNTYYNCADFVRQYLVKAGLLKQTKDKKPTVDGLYFELYRNGFVPPIDVINDWYFKDKVPPASDVVKA